MNNGWPVRPLVEACQIKPPKSEARDRLAADETVSFLPMEDMGIQEMFVRATQERRLSAVQGSYTYFADDDVLLAKITPCFENGKLGIAQGLTNGIGFGSSEYIVFRPDKRLSKEWLYYYLSRETFRVEGASRMSGAVGHKRVSKEFIESYPIPIPPLPEQRRIVGILDEAFEGTATAKANAEKNLQNARALFESHLYSIFTKPRKGWAVLPIGEVAEVFDGPHATPKTVDSGPVFLGISALHDGEINLGETRHVTPEDFSTWTRRVKPQTDDVVFSYETRLGQAAIVPSGLECCLGRRMGLVRVNRKRLNP
jgi:type I restriction enzyme S subunit